MGHAQKVVVGSKTADIKVEQSYLWNAVIRRPRRGKLVVGVTRYIGPQIVKQRIADGPGPPYGGGPVVRREADIHKRPYASAHVVEQCVVGAAKKLILPRRVVEASVVLISCRAVGNTGIENAPIGNAIWSIADRLTNRNAWLVPRAESPAIERAAVEHAVRRRGGGANRGSISDARRYS